MTRADKVLSFIKKYCRVPEGKLVGQPVKIAPFQERFIRDLYDNPHGTRRAILSIARKNSKTTTMAFLILAHLVGSEAKQNTQIVSGAMSRDQAALVFELCCKMIAQSPELSKIIRIIPSKKKLIGIPMNVEYIALAADGKTAHGLSPVLGILDETAQVVGARSEFIEAITTAQGAHENPLLIYISTQAANDSDYLSIIIDDARKSNDPHTVCHVYEADPDCDIMDEEQWKKANPALGLFRSIDDVRELANQAKRMPSSESSFRNLILNQRISTNSPFISKGSWLACVAQDAPELEDCEEFYGGLDLSARNDLTAFVLIGRYQGAWYPFVWTWTPRDGLEERARRDRAPYDMWVRQGFLLTTPSASIEYEYVAREMADICSRVNVTAIAYDRWRIDIMKKELERLGVELPLVPWGQGFKDASIGLDALEARILNKTLQHSNHPVLNMCAANTMVTRDPAGNRKPDKSKTSGRIDAMVALAMACGISEQNAESQGSFDSFISNPLVM